MVVLEYERSYPLINTIPLAVFSPSYQKMANCIIQGNDSGKALQAPDQFYQAYIYLIRLSLALKILPFKSVRFCSNLSNLFQSGAYCPDSTTACIKACWLQWWQRILCSGLSWASPELIISQRKQAVYQKEQLGCCAHTSALE